MAATAEVVFDAASKQVENAAGAIGDFADSALDDDVLTVPGVGSKVAERFAAHGVNTTRNLLGKFLSFSNTTEDSDGAETANKFVGWLNEIGVVRQCQNVITFAIASKAEAALPGTFTYRG